MEWLLPLPNDTIPLLLLLLRLVRLLDVLESGVVVVDNKEVRCCCGAIGESSWSGG